MRDKNKIGYLGIGDWDLYNIGYLGIGDITKYRIFAI